jgi:hypothetical protein
LGFTSSAFANEEKQVPEGMVTVKTAGNDQTCQAPYTLSKGKWQAISLPCEPPPNESTVQAVFGDDIPGIYDSEWVVYSYPGPAGEYQREALDSALKQGKGYWILSTKEEAILKLPAGSKQTPITASAACMSDEGCFEIPILAKSENTQWNLLGYPGLSASQVSDLRVITHVATSPNNCSRAKGCTLDQAKEDKVFHNQFWSYPASGSGYINLSATDSLNAWTGLWATALDDAAGKKPRLLVPLVSKSMNGSSNFSENHGQSSEPSRPSPASTHTPYALSSNQLSKKEILYASPGGTGEGKSESSPASLTRLLQGGIKINGKTIVAADGSYSIGMNSDTTFVCEFTSTAGDKASEHGDGVTSGYFRFNSETPHNLEEWNPRHASATTYTTNGYITDLSFELPLHTNNGITGTTTISAGSPHFWYEGDANKIGSMSSTPVYHGNKYHLSEDSWVISGDPPPWHTKKEHTRFKMKPAKVSIDKMTGRWDVYISQSRSITASGGGSFTCIREGADKN